MIYDSVSRSVSMIIGEHMVGDVCVYTVGRCRHVLPGYMGDYKHEQTYESLSSHTAQFGTQRRLWGGKKENLWIDLSAIGQTMVYLYI